MYVIIKCNFFFKLNIKLSVWFENGFKMYEIIRYINCLDGLIVIIKMFLVYCF